MEIIARGRATIYTQTDGKDAVSIYLSRQNYVVSTDKDGKIHTAVTVTTTVSAMKGGTSITPAVGTLPTVAGCTLSKSGTTVTIVFTAGTSLAENGTIDIPVTADGTNFYLSFAYAKARTGNNGVDANLFDWVSDWNTNKTLINENSVITPKIFAGVKNSNNTLTGVALGHFPLTTLNASGQAVTETINGIYGFKDGNKTFFIDSGGNVQLGRGNQFIKFNAATGAVEFGADVSLNWIGATYINASGLFTGTLSANTVNAIAINASQITAGTINASRIDVASLKASLITATNIEALTLNVSKGTVGGWTIDADSIFKGTKNNSSGAYTAAAGAMTVGSNGIRGYKWRLDSNGAGAVAGGNIAWDASGNVVFASSVSLNWTNAVNTAKSELQNAIQHVRNEGLLYCRGTGLNRNANRLLRLNGVDIYNTGGRGLQLTVIRRSDLSVITNTLYDVYGSDEPRMEMAETLNALSDDVIVVITSYDAIVINNALSVAMQRCGGSGILLTSRNPYALTGIPGTGKGGGIEIYTDDSATAPYAEIATKIQNGVPQGINFIQSMALACAEQAQSTASAITQKAINESWETKLTYIDANGIFTGILSAYTVNALSLNAAQITAGTISADRIAAGSITAAKLDAASIKSSIINTDYINGLSCTFNRGTIGGWTIGTDHITSGSVGTVGQMPIQIRSAATGSGYWYIGDYKPQGITMTWHQSNNAGHFIFGQVAASGNSVKTGFIGIQMMAWDNTEYFCLSANSFLSGSKEVYNRIAGWAFDNSKIWKNNVSLAADGSIQNGTLWQLNNNGSGRLASGNITWDASGNVSFASSVSLNWTAPINSLTSALGGSSFPKLTKIDATGIYTGTLNASQITAGTISADRIAAGSITAAKLDAASIKSSIINTDYINGLTCTFNRGTIGGWTIHSGSLANTHIALDNANRRVVVYGAGASATSGQRSQLYYNSDSDFGFLATNSSGSGIACFGASNYIAGWTVDIDSLFRGAKANTSGACTSGSGYVTIGSAGIRGYKWRLDSNGAGAVAGGNIAWDAAGNVTFAASVSLNWKNYTDEKVGSVDGMSRNYAQDTSADWTYEWADCYENQCLFQHKILSANWKAGDVIHVSFDYLYDYIYRDTNNNNRMCVQGSGDVTGWNAGFGLYDFMHLIDFNNTYGEAHVEYSFVINSEQARNNYFMMNIRHDYIYGDVYIRNLMVTKGSKSSEWMPAQEDIKKRLTRITSSGIYTGTVSAYQVRVDSILIVGGSNYNGSISVRDASNATKVTLNRSGITAVGGTIGGWTIASDRISKNSVVLNSDGSITNGTKWKLNNDGSGQFADGNISWTAAGTVTVSGTINASAGTIGGFEIGYGRIGSTASGTGDGGGLAIYNDLFRVGSSSSYVLFGDDTFPASAGGAFTATGRITNNKYNSYFTNCGVYIDVKNASRNFGIYSNAALLAPALISNKIKTIVFSGSGYSIDFSQNNLFFIYGTANYSVTLPSESSVASMFGVSSLPSDFACVFTLVYNYNYGNRITINSVRNHDGNPVNFNMEKGDTLTLICAKFPSFHYQMLNYRQS